MSRLNKFLPPPYYPKLLDSSFRDFTVELWARGGNLEDRGETANKETLLSYAAQQLDASGQPTGFYDDAIRIERVEIDVNNLFFEAMGWAQDTQGAVVVSINSNQHEDGGVWRTAWIMFYAEW